MATDGCTVCAKERAPPRPACGRGGAVVRTGRDGCCGTSAGARYCADPGRHRIPFTWPGSSPMTYRTRRPCTRRAGARQPRGLHPRASGACGSLAGDPARPRPGRVRGTGRPVMVAVVRPGQPRPWRSAGWAPAATRSATAARGSRPVTRDSPTRTASAAGVGVRDQVVRAADTGLGDLDDVVGDLGGDALEGGAVDLEVLQVARVDADDLGSGVHGALRLLLVVRLDERGEPDRLGSLDQGDQGLLVEGGDDQQGEVGAVRPGLPQLVRGDDEVLAQDRDVDLGADRLQVGERAAEAALLGEDRDDGRAARLVVRGERGRVGDGGQGPLEGDERLTSQMTVTPSPRRAATPSLAWGARAARSFSSSRLTRACRSARSARTPSMISSSTLTRAAPFRTVMREQDQPYRWYPQERPGLASGLVASHYLGIQGASAEPNGRFRTTVKTSRTAPTPHHQAGARAIRRGCPRQALVSQRTQTAAKRT